MPGHKVRKPFLCREGQFAAKGYPGRVLVVGIAAAALTGEIHKFTIGKNPIVYEAPVSEIMVTGHKWINKKGKLLFITPLDLCEKRTSHETKKLHSVPVPETKREVQRTD